MLVVWGGSPLVLILCVEGRGTLLCMVFMLTSITMTMMPVTIIVARMKTPRMMTRSLLLEMNPLIIALLVAIITIGTSDMATLIKPMTIRSTAT